MAAANENSSALCSVEEFVAQKYDYVIVGGGTAGLVVAARLTENPNVTVGVIEAGSNHLDDPMVSIPNLYSQIIFREDYDWMMTSTPQAGAKNKLFSQPRGKGLGGSSMINYQMYVRGSKRDYDDWEQFGGKAWSWDALLPYFKKHQRFDPPAIAHQDPTFRPHGLAAKVQGNDGPIVTSFAEEVYDFEETFIKVTNEFGGRPKTLIDAYSGDHMGVYSSLQAIDRSGPAATRSYAATGYLKPNLGRPNLKVLTEAYATKILMRSTEAQGVTFVHGKKDYEVSAVKEVILAAGVFKTPQLLELSGIGDPAVLKQAGVDCVVENKAIGANLQDHVLTGAVYDLKDGYTSMDLLHDPKHAQKAQETYMTTGKGPFANPTVTMGFKSYESLASGEDVKKTIAAATSAPGESEFTKAQQEAIIKQLSDPAYATIQCFCFPAAADLTKSHAETEKFPPARPGICGMSTIVGLQHPFSRGTVHIDSNDPSKQPAIDPGYYKNPGDLKMAVASMRWLLQVAEQPEMAKYIEKRNQPAEDINLSDDKALEDYILGHSVTEYHPIGTTAIGQAVDSRLLVKGTSKLRVVDASVFPMNVSGNIMGTVYAIAEKAGDLIKEDDGRF